MVQLSHLYLTTGKTIALSRRTLVGIVMSLLFNMLSSLVIASLPRSKHLLISWLQSLSVVILEPKKIKSVTVSTVSPSICHEVMGPDAMILAFWILSFKPALLKVELQALLLLLILEKLCFWNFLSFRRVAKWPPACCYRGPCSWVRRWSQIPACRGDCIRAPCRKGLAVGLSRRIWVLVLGLSISSCVSRHDLHPPCGSIPSLALICPPRGTAVIMKQTK